MTYLRAVGSFLYGLFIGDDWRITLGVVLTLIAGRLLLSTSIPAAAVAVLVGLGLGAMFAGNLLVAARRSASSRRAD
jgi:cyanate permease